MYNVFSDGYVTKMKDIREKIWGNLKRKRKFVAKFGENT